MKALRTLGVAAILSCTAPLAMALPSATDSLATANQHQTSARDGNHDGAETNDPLRSTPVQDAPKAMAHGTIHGGTDKPVDNDKDSQSRTAAWQSLLPGSIQ